MPRTRSSPADPVEPAEPGGAATTSAAGRLWVVLPVFDEAAAVERVIREWIPVLVAADAEVVLLVVDDGSTDETPRILERLARAESRLRVVRQENRGHGAACRRGYELAVAPDSDAEWILQIDSDGQCDPRDFAAFWRDRTRHALQLGRRRRRRDGCLRAATSHALAVLVSLAAGRRIRDPNVPFRLLSRDVLARALARLPANEVELSNAALAVVAAEIETPRWVDIRFRRRFAGRSHYRFGRMVRLAGGLLCWLVTRRASPEPGKPSPRPQPRAMWALAGVAWCSLLVAIALYAWRNLGNEAIWFDEAVQVHTSLGIHPLAPPFTPAGTLRDVVVRNAADQLDPGGFGILLHVWMRAFGTGAGVLHALSGLLALAGLAALAALAGRWLRHPLAPPAAVALALADPLVRDHALEIRAYALELAGVWIAFWAADRLLARPTGVRALTLGLTIVVWIGSRYSALLTAGALAGALILELLPLRVQGGERRRPALLAATLLPVLLGLAAIVRWSLPGLLRRAGSNDGSLVDYLDAQKLGSLSVGEAVVTALRHLGHPAVVCLTLAAVLAIWTGARGRSAGAPASRLVFRSALFLLVATILVWPWHPWDPRLKWSLYLRLVSMVCLLRLAADLAPRIALHKIGRPAAVAATLLLIGTGAWRAGSHERWRWDVALPALERVGEVFAVDGLPAGAVAVEVHPMPAVRYYYELGSLRGRPEYPRAFAFLAAGTPEIAFCSARWLLSFDSLASLERRYPGYRFEEDAVADQLLWISPADPAAPTPCGSSGSSPAGRGSTGRAR